MRSPVRFRDITIGSLVALCGIIGLTSTVPAATYFFDTNYCSTACNLTAGTVTVTEVADPDAGGPLLSYLHYSVALSEIGGVQTYFRTNHTSFLLQMQSGITGLKVSNVTSNGAIPWIFEVPGEQQNPINNSTPPGDWSAGFKIDSNTTNGYLLSFDLKADQALTLASVAQYPDKDGNQLWFAAEISQNGNTGYVGASLKKDDAPPPPGVPVPGALPLFITGMGVLAFLARRRKRQSA